MGEDHLWKHCISGVKSKPEQHFASAKNTRIAVDISCLSHAWCAKCTFNIDTMVALVLPKLLRVNLRHQHVNVRHQHSLSKRLTSDVMLMSNVDMLMSKVDMLMSKVDKTSS